MVLVLQTIFTPLLDRPQLLEGIWLDGNWHLASTPVWSRDLKASLAIAADHFPLPTPLLLWVRVFGATSMAPRILTVISPGHKDQILAVSTSQPVAVLTKTPVHEAGARYSPLFLTLDAISSPYGLNLSSDDRLLGVQITSLAADQPMLEWPLDFTTSDRAASVLGRGWAEIEDGSGVWSMGNEAHLTLPGYLRQPGADTLLIEADVLNRPDETQSLVADVSCNGQIVANLQFPLDLSEPLRCPLPNWYNNIDYSIVLHFRNISSPRQLGINSDDRPLGLHVHRIDVTGQAAFSSIGQA